VYNTKSLLYRCEQIIRDIANDVALRITDKPFLKTVTHRLKFENETDWNVLCSLMDVLGDTELAKENFLKFDLSGPTKIEDYGEQYLRLYGIVNAIYLQKSALISFVELIKLKNKKILVAKLDNLKIMELRHIVGAHTIDFIDNGKKNPHQIQRGSLANYPIKTSDSKGNYKEYDLKKLLLEYNAVAEELLINATDKFISTVFKNGGQKLTTYKDRFEAIKSEKSGAIVVYSVGSSQPITIMIVK